MRILIKVMVSIFYILFLYGCNDLEKTLLDELKHSKSIYDEYNNSILDYLNTKSNEEPERYLKRYNLLNKVNSLSSDFEQKILDRENNNLKETLFNDYQRSITKIILNNQQGMSKSILILDRKILSDKDYMSEKLFKKWLINKVNMQLYYISKYLYESTISS